MNLSRKLVFTVLFLISLIAYSTETTNSELDSNNSKQKIGFFGPMKAFDSARTSFQRLPNGGLRATIHHEPMEGLTVKQFRWWFENIEGMTTYNGVDFNGIEIPRYHLWHPHDHIKVYWKKKLLDENGRVLPGSIMRIKESFGEYLVDENVLITRFDDEEYNFQLGMFGIKGGELIHAYQDSPEGLLFMTQLTINNDQPIIGNLVTWLVTKFLINEEMLKAWMQHNIEESGESAKFIPILYDYYNKS
tara:strand:- start:3948 stop:4688 length:741 start_codon:yes stop_codon:yes gene_type:complete